MNINLGSLGSVLAIIVLVLAIVLFAIGQLPLLFAALFALLAVARLV
jgi:hypothetical protein